MFTGREFLKEVGLYDYRNRVYSQELGRFLQTDPIFLTKKRGGRVGHHRTSSNKCIILGEEINGFEFKAMT